MMPFSGTGSFQPKKQVIAINCCDAQAAPFIADRLRKQQIECLDIISYESYLAFEQSGINTVMFRQLPLMFILHQEDLGKACRFAKAEGPNIGKRKFPFSDN